MARKGQEKLLPMKPEQAADRAVATPEDTRHLGAPAVALIDRGHEHAEPQTRGRDETTAPPGGGRPPEDNDAGNSVRPRRQGRRGHVALCAMLKAPGTEYGH